VNIWNLLPAALVSRAKAIAAALGGIAEIVVSFFPSVALNHWAAVVIAVLTALGVYTVPNGNAKTEQPGGLLGPDGKPYVYRKTERADATADRSPTPPSGFSPLNYGPPTYNPVAVTDLQAYSPVVFTDFRIWYR
jgi:hypothetical protein